MGNLEKVQQIYAAFGLGDIAAILEYLAEDVEWEYGIAATDVPWFQSRKGRSEVPKFFESLNAIELSKFQPKTFLVNNNVVVVLIDVELTVKTTGIKVVEMDETHIWHFNPQGQVIKFGHKLDTHRHWLAYHGEVS